MNPEITSAQYIEDFLKGLLEEAGMDTASPEVYAQMLTDLRARLNDRLFSTIIMNLNEGKLTEFREMAEKGADGETLQKFIDDNVSDAQNLFAQAMLNFRKDYLGLKE